MFGLPCRSPRYRGSLFQDAPYPVLGVRVGLADVAPHPTRGIIPLEDAGTLEPVATHALAQDEGAVDRSGYRSRHLRHSPLVREKVSTTTTVSASVPLYAELQSWLDQAELVSSERFTRTSEEERVLHEEQRKVYSCLFGLESPIGQATSDLLEYQRWLNTL